MSLKRGAKSPMDLFQQYKARSLLTERASVLPSSTVVTTPTTAELMTPPERWLFPPPELLKKLPSSQAPLFFPHDASPATPDQVAAVAKQEADYMLRIFYVLWMAFLDFRQTTYNTHIKNVQEIGMQTFVTIDNEKRDRWNGYWSTFPENRIPDLQDPHVRLGVLTANSCFDTAHMQKLVEQVFKGMKVTLEEVRFRVKLGHPSVVFLTRNKYINPSIQDFWCIRVTSTITQRQWAIHLSGPQYGKCEPGTNWNDFVREYIDGAFAVLPFGTLSRYTTATSQTKGMAGMNHDLAIRSMQAFHDTVDAGMTRKNLTWTDILHKSDEDFMRHADKVLRVGNKAVETFMKDLGSLTKRRQKAERWDKRHAEDMKVEHERICGETIYAEEKKGVASSRLTSEE